MVKLQVLICTIGAEGIGRVVESSRPEVEGVEYIVSWQLPDGDMDVPEALAVRDDIKVCKVNNRGGSRRYSRYARSRYSAHRMAERQKWEPHAGILLHRQSALYDALQLLYAGRHPDL